MTDPTRNLPDQPPKGREPAPLLRTIPQAPPCIAVIGTEPERRLVARVLEALGVPSLAPGTGTIATSDAPRSPLESFDERLLRHIGTRPGQLPPAIDPDWELDAELATLVEPAGEVFEEASAGATVSWSDPALPLLLPFWRHALVQPILVVLAIAAPEQVGEPSAAPGSIAVALARYERELRIALCAAAGLPVLVVDEACLDDPELLGKDLAAFLAGHGVLTRPAVDRGQLLVDRATPVTRIGAPGSQAILPEIEELHRVVAALAGVHGAFSPPAIGEESPWTSALLAAESDLDHVVDALLWTTRHIEPIIRSEPRPELPPVAEPVRANDEEREGEEFDEPKDDGPYPLNAAEDRRAYHRWLRARHLPVVVDGPDEAARRKARTRAPLLGAREPLVSILVPVWRPPLWALERCVESVLAQTFGDWQLCLCDDASEDEDLTAYLKSLRRLDRRITVTACETNGGISAATNRALDFAKGQFIAFLDNDDRLAETALEEVAKAIAAEPEADLLYSDEDKIDAAGERFDPLFKPDWSPDLLLSFAYVCHLTVVRRELLADLGGLRSEFDGSQDYDLSLRASERARRIVHIPEVLYHWRTLPGSAARDTPGAVAKPWAYVAGRRAIEDAMQRRGEEAEVSEVEGFPGRYHVRRAVTSKPLVSIIIPFRDEPALLATCATTLREAPGYDRFELLLVDNGSELPETEELLDRLAGEPDIRVIDAPGPFNWAAINNAAVREAHGDVLLFMNNDIEARRERWLEALLGHALRPEVGAVGARLVYPDGVIQHAGVGIGLGGIAGHVLRGLPGDHPGYNSMAIQTRNCSVVTGACMATRREVFEAAGGFDELLPVAFNDVDYCLKLREQGYLIVYTPLAELVHHESRSRGHTDDLVESRRIVSRWGHAIAAGDPYLSVRLSHWRYWCPLSTAQEDHRWKTYLETSVLMRASSSSTSDR